MLFAIASFRNSVSAALTLAVLCATWLVGARPAQAGPPEISVTEISILKSEIRINDSTSLPGGFYFAACIRATGVNAADPGLLVRPDSTEDALIEASSGLYCRNQRFGSQASLDMDYPSTGGTYTFQLNTASGSPPVLEYTGDYDVAHPDNPTIVEPVSGENVISDRDLLVSWSNLDLCTVCDGVTLAASDPTGEVYRSLALPPGSGSSTVPGSALETSTAYAIQVATFDGPAVPGTDMQQGSTFTVDARYRNISTTTNVVGVDRTIDLQVVELLKGVDRDDGIVAATGAYFVEACVEADGISTAVRNPVLLRPAPLGSIELQPESASSFCVDMSYDDRAALDQEFPSDGGTYRFDIEQADGATVKIPVVWDDAPPGGSIAYTAPDDGANVPANEDLMVTWDLDLGAPECSVPGDCGDFIGFFLVDDGLDEDVVVEPALPITTTGQTVDGADLDAGAYSIETETYVGVFAESATDGTSDDYLFSRANEDINLINITVPEPGAALLGVAAFATLGILGQRRRQPRQKA